VKAQGHRQIGYRFVPVGGGSPGPVVQRRAMHAWPPQPCGPKQVVSRRPDSIVARSAVNSSSVSPQTVMDTHSPAWNSMSS
jgi:hypothetical protein